MTTRRGFLRATGLAGAGLLAPLLARSESAERGERPEANTSRLTRFVDELPRPARLSGSTLEIAMTEFRQQLHSELPPTTLWGYGGTYPGPTIEAVRGQPLRITWRNQLDRPGLAATLPVDQTLHWADPLRAHPSAAPYDGPVATVVHLHGGETEPASDGHPDAWFTPNFARKGPGWVKEWCDYANIQPAATLWYHDHTLGITRLNVYAGLAGFYLLRDPEREGPLNLPSGAHEREIVIQDRTFSAQGALLYPSAGLNPEAHPFWVPEVFGDTIVVNGKVWPFMNVEPRKYRLRLLNGSNARFYNLRLANGRPFVQIGTDTGFLAAPVMVTALLLAPGERADVIVDFSGLKAGTRIVVTNDARTPYPKGEEADPRTVGQIMQFRVAAATGPDTSAIPARLGAVPALGPAAVTRTLTVSEEMGPKGPLAGLLDGKTWSAPVSETPKLGATEIWEIVNLTEDAHPIHLHLVSLQLLNRQGLRVRAYMKAPAAQRQLRQFLVGAPRPAAPNERGWKDTVRANPREVTRLAVRFGPVDGREFPFDATARPGYVWHCHILEHEDNEMMRPYTIVT